MEREIFSSTIKAIATDFSTLSSNFRGRRGGREKERERSACLPRVHACTRQLTAGVFAGKWKLDERRALATGPFTAAHVEESSAFGDREREKRRKKEEEERKDRLPGARSSFRAN